VKHCRILSRAILVALCWTADAGIAGAEQSDHCVLFGGQPGFVNVSLHIMLRSTGATDSVRSVTFTPCVPLGPQSISLRRSRLHSAFYPKMHLSRGDTSIELPSKIALENSEKPPVLGGSSTANFVFAVPPMNVDDRLHISVTTSANSVLGGNQVWFEYLEHIRNVLEYKVTFQSERADVELKLLDPNHFLRGMTDLPDQKEWISAAPLVGIIDTVPRLGITTLDSWEKVAREFRAAFFLDEHGLRSLKALDVPHSQNAWALFAELTKRLSAVKTAETRHEPRDIQNIIETQGGDCKALSFLLLNLLRWNGIDAELVLYSNEHDIAPDDIFSFGKIDHILVYVPALDRYMDPTGPLTWQPFRDHEVRTKTRIHVSGILRSPSMEPRNACSDYCIRSPVKKIDPYIVHTPTEVIRLPEKSLNAAPAAPSSRFSRGD